MAPSTLANHASRADRRRLVAALGAAIVALYLWMRRRMPRGVKCVVGDKGHWLLGLLPVISNAVEKKEHLTLLHSWHKEYGENYVWKMPMQPPVLNTADPVVVEHILKTRFDNYVKGSWFRDRLSDLLGEGIFNVDGEMWHKQRKTASWMFTHNQFKNHIWRVVERNCFKVQEILRQLKSGETLDMFSLMNRFTLDTIGEVGFGKNVGSLENADSPFLKAFDQGQQIVVKRFIFPGWQLTRRLGLFYESEATSCFKILADYSTGVVRELQQNLDKEAGDSFVGIFMKEAQKKGEPINEDFMKDMVLNFLIAGRDTTAQALAWCFFILMDHPEVETKMLAEVREVCGDRAATYEDLGKLRYVQAVVDETLRLYPSVPSDSKETLHDDTLPNGIFLPAGTVVQFHPWSMGRSTKLWGDDAETFRPERWLDQPRPSPWKYPVFNAGPRECLGMRLAWVEMKMALVCILRTVKLSLAVPREAIKPDMQLTLGMSSGLPVTVELRS